MIVTQEINLNIIPGGIKPRIRVSQYDNGTRVLRFILYRGTEKYTTSGLTAQIRGTKPDKHGFVYPATYSNGVVTADLTQQMAAVAGDVECEITLMESSSNVLGTANFILEVEKAAVGDDTIVSDSELAPLIDGAHTNALKAEGYAVGRQDGQGVPSTSPYYHNNAEFYRDQAGEAASSAANSASTASTKASEASTSASNAANSASTASTKASEASTSAGNASSSATTATNKASEANSYAQTSEAWAVGTKNGTAVPSTDPQYENNAKYWSDIAATYAAQLGSAVKWKASILFAAIPVSGMQNGDFYNIKDAFTTDARFLEGAGMECPAGTDIVWAGDESKWNVMTPSGVNSFNGRKGTVVPANNDYTASQIKFGANSDVNTELGNKQNKTLDTPIIVESVQYSTVETALNAINNKSGGSSDITVIADEFNPNKQDGYAVGEYCTYNGHFYRCTTAHTGEWNASHFTQTTVDDELDTKMKKGVDYVTAGLKYGVTLGSNATAEGYNTKPTGNQSHGEGRETEASGNYSHSQGYQTHATGVASHSEGSGTKATGSSSHAEGNDTIASHGASHAGGYNTKTGNDYQHVQGKYNVGKSTTAFEIGKGTSNSARSNAFEVEWSGNVKAAGDIEDGNGNKISDVPSWAKQSSKPSYSDSEITNLGLVREYKPAYSSSDRTFTMGSNGEVYVIVGFEIFNGGRRAGVWLATYSSVSGEGFGMVTKLIGGATLETNMDVTVSGNTLTLKAGFATAWTVYKLVNNLN